MKIPDRLIEFLNQNQVAYEIVHHPVAFTAQELAAIEGVKGHEHAKVVMVKAGARLVMLVLPASYRVDWKRVKVVTGDAPALAAEADFRALFPDCEIGTMPPFGHLYGVEMLLDVGFEQNTRIAFEAGTHSDAIKMSYADFTRLAQAHVIDFAEKLH
ncbi:MAG: YbaK/EbsC family protein [Verrucomicrobiota bacterium]|jgi:Ala-tRNA(Pro) deacylase